jgi:hypothetical protein
MKKLLIALCLLTTVVCRAQSWPIHREAETEDSAVGTYDISCPDVGGGSAVGDMNSYSGDYTQYFVYLPKDSIYKVTIRIAGSVSTRFAGMLILDSANNVAGKIYFKGTSSPKVYTTLSTHIFLKAGNRRMRFKPFNAKINFNWFEITPSSGLYVANHFESDGGPTTGTEALWSSCRADNVNSGYTRPDLSRNWIRQTARENSLSLLSTEAREGCYSAKFELNKGDSSTWPYIRSEIYLGELPEKTMWFGFSTKSPTDVTNDGLPHIFFQIHGWDDVGEGARSPYFAMRIENDSIFAKILWASTAIQANDNDKDGEQVYNLGKYEPNVWNDWIIYYKASHTNTGRVDIWRNGELKMTRQNLPNAYNDVHNGYPKFGIYKWGWVAPYFPYSPYNTVITYLDNLKIGGATSSFDEVNPINP